MAGAETRPDPALRDAQSADSNPSKLRVNPPRSELEGQLFAAVDLGSNSFHLIVARYQHGILHVIDQLKEMVQLAAGVSDSGALDPTVEHRALHCLSRFRERIDHLASANIRAVGTNALRRMAPGLGFHAAAEAALGQAIEIVSGHEEARLIYLGVAHGISERGQQRLVIDIGGGSTEFIIGRDLRPVRLASLYFGCVGVARQHFEDGRITARRWQRARTAVGIELQQIAGSFSACGWQEVLGSSGTMRAVRSAVLARGWSERGITPQSLAQLRDYLVDVGDSARIDLPGLTEPRRSVFVGGAVIVDACIEHLGLEQILVTDYAMREGLLYDMIGRMLHADPRLGSVQALMERYHVDASQAERVRAAARQLFDQLARPWQLSKSGGELLEWAAQLHEIGLTISHHGYHRHGAYLIENSDLPAFSRLEQSVLGVLIRNHRRKPDVDLYQRLISRVRTDARRLTVLLRLAVLLNRSRSSRALPTLSVSADSDRLRIEFVPGWLEAHPLALADLQAEKSQLRRLGLQLDFA